MSPDGAVASDGCCTVGSLDGRSGPLEVIRAAPRRHRRSVTLLFIHGAYAAAWCWQRRFLPFFAAAGFPSVAISLRGHGASAGRALLDLAAIADYVDDLRCVLHSLDGPVVLVGHSMGGFIAQKHLETGGTAAGLVLLASVPPFGLAGSSLDLAVGNPMLLWRMSLLHGFGYGVGSRGLVRDALFSADIDDSDLDRYVEALQPESSRAILDMHGLDLISPGRVPSLPMLVVGAGRDALISPVQTAATASLYGVASIVLPDLAHAMMLEPRWDTAAVVTRDWLDATFAAG